MGVRNRPLRFLSDWLPLQVVPATPCATRDKPQVILLRPCQGGPHRSKQHLLAARPAQRCTRTQSTIILDIKTEWYKEKETERKRASEREWAKESERTRARGKEREENNHPGWTFCTTPLTGAYYLVLTFSSSQNWSVGESFWSGWCPSCVSFISEAG